jgi:2-dehydropantoate 2-reductase
MVIDRNGDNAVIKGFLSSCARAEGIEADLTDSIDRLLWEKFVRMSANSASGSLLRSTIGPILAHPETRAFFRQLVDEAIAIAAATGNPLDRDFGEETMAFFASLPPTLRSSMAEDLERGRRLELPWLSGRIHALGIEHGVSTPAHTAAYRGLILYADGNPGAVAAT